MSPLPLAAVGTLSFVLLLRPVTPVEFTAFYAMTIGVFAYIYDGTDNRWLSTLPLERIRSHVTAAIVAQSLGTIAAPFFFALVLHTPIPDALVVAGGMLMAVSARPIWGPALSHWARPAEGTGPGSRSSGLPRPGPPGKPLALTDWVFLAYTLCMFAFAVLLAGNVVLFTRSYFRMENPTETAGILLAASNGLGVIAVLSYMVLPARVAAVRRRRAEPDRPRPASSGVLGGFPRTVPFPLPVHLALVAGMAVTAVLLLLRASSSLAYILLLGGVAGISFGFFRLLSREYASRRVAVSGRTRLLSMFNSLHGVAALVAYGLMTVATLLHGRARWPLPNLMVDGLTLLAVCAFACVGILAYRLRRERQMDVGQTGPATLAG